MLWAIYHYATKALPLDRPLDPSHVIGAGRRSSVLRYVVREQFLNVMRPTLFGRWRGDDQMEHAFNAACRIMGWRFKLSVTPKIMAELSYDLDFRDRPNATISGCLLDEDKVTLLWNKLSSYDDPLFDLPPKGGGLTADPVLDLTPPYATITPPDTPRDSLTYAVTPEAFYAREELHSNVSPPPVYARAESISR